MVERFSGFLSMSARPREYSLIDVRSVDVRWPSRVRARRTFSMAS